MSERLTLASPTHNSITFNQLYKPHGAYASTHEKEVRAFQDADIKYGDEALSGAIRHAILADMAITFMLSECQSFEGFCTELVLYSHPRLLRPLQGVCVPFIIKAYESQAGSHGFAMEVPHQRGWRTAEGTLSKQHKESIVQAYRLIHAQGVLHGDVSLKNILISDEGEVTIVDFGKGRCASEMFSFVVKQCKACDLAYEMRKILFILDVRDARSTECERTRMSLYLSSSKPYSSTLMPGDDFYIPLSTLRSWQAHADAAAKAGTMHFTIPHPEDVHIRRHQGGSSGGEFTMAPARLSGWTQMERSHLEHISNAISSSARTLPPSLLSDGPAPPGRPVPDILSRLCRGHPQPDRYRQARAAASGPSVLRLPSIPVSRSTPPSPQYDTEMASRKRRRADYEGEKGAPNVKGPTVIRKRVRLPSLARDGDMGTKSDDEVQVYRRTPEIRRIRNRALDSQPTSAASRRNRARDDIRRLAEAYSRFVGRRSYTIPDSGERKTPTPANDRRSFLRNTDITILSPVLDEDLEKTSNASNDDSVSSEDGDDDLPPAPESDPTPSPGELLPPNTSETSTFIRPFSVVLVNSDLGTTIFHAAQDVFHYVADFLHLRPDPPRRVEQPLISHHSQATKPSSPSPKANQKRKRQDDGNAHAPPLKRTKYMHTPSGHSGVVS
ncbi:hypothetical protein EVG20_g123 [Dentipellis fragilis]|uniref:Uncharacterized protein n=1 Tax=Dentipellis fragilis TaxID=205917 RepID=A0A4Y9ZE63_9AGAM|nr:hypothetical protein EVG20_g123 [Dentipellis fragilis]